MSKAETPVTEIAVEGDLLFSTVVAKRDALLKQLQSLQGICRLNFAAVNRVDSSALSFWLCCLRYAQKREVTLEIINLPDDLRSIAQLVGVDEQLL